MLMTCRAADDSLFFVHAASAAVDRVSTAAAEHDIIAGSANENVTRPRQLKLFDRREDVALGIASPG